MLIEWEKGLIINTDKIVAAEGKYSPSLDQVTEVTIMWDDKSKSTYISHNARRIWAALLASCSITSTN